MVQIQAAFFSARRYSGSGLAMRVHPSITWALFARVISTNYVSARGASASSLVNGIVEANIRLFVGILLEDIELDLKESLETSLARTHGPSWWMSLPKHVQRSAQNRHRWTATQLGARRLVQFPGVHWLTMGDVLAVLAGLSRADWKLCLSAETARRSDFDRAIRRVKVFRDYIVAHPKPRTTSTAELLRLCATVQRTPEVLCPTEWKAATVLLKSLNTLPDAQRWAIHVEATGFASNPSGALKEWARNIASRNSGDAGGQAIPARFGSKWSQEVVKAAATYDGGGSVFWGNRSLSTASNPNA